MIEHFEAKPGERDYQTLINEALEQAALRLEFERATRPAAPAGA